MDDKRDDTLTEAQQIMSALCFILRKFPTGSTPNQQHMLNIAEETLKASVLALDAFIDTRKLGD